MSDYVERCGVCVRYCARWSGKGMVVGDLGMCLGVRPHDGASAILLLDSM